MIRCWARLKLLIIVLNVVFAMACAQKAAEPDLADEPAPEVEAVSIEPETDWQETSQEPIIEEPPPEEASAEYDWRDTIDELTGQDIYFNKGSAALSPEAQSILIGKAKWLSRYPEVMVIVEGHSDEPGTAEFNLALGARRAGAVKSFLIRMNVDPRRMSAVSFGKERPVDPERSDIAAERNRRVHISVEEW